MTEPAPIDAASARRFIDDRRTEVLRRLAAVERRLAGVREARGDWTDEEHDPEGFTLVGEWSQAEGTRSELRTELRELEAADTRLAGDAYGVCAHCGRPIPSPQLERRPARTECVACTDRRR